jgi:predicted AAA+ superfamily ATPase
METLSHLFAVKFKKQDILPRKNAPHGDRVAIYGAPRSGKTSLLLSGAQNEPFLYVDLEDRRVSIEALNRELPAFAKSNKIAFLAVDNYNERLILPTDLTRIWIAQHEKSSLTGFEPHRIAPFDFEEFLAVSKTPDPEIAFNEFLRGGALFEPHDEPHRTVALRRLLERIAKRQPPVMEFMVLHSADRLTPHQVYSALKKRVKISKDTLYAFLREALDREILFTAHKWDLAGAPAKFYAFDHALRDGVTFDKSLLKTFETMIALELLKHNETIYYDDGIDLFLPKSATAVIAAPFITKEAMIERTKRIAHKARRIEFVTMGFEAQYKIAEAAPFWDWALRA